jgi:hypothetical protein
MSPDVATLPAMSRKRDELIEIRKEHFELVARLKRVGDYGAGAADTRQMAETVLKLIEHMLERTK